jgi:GxxExxY protein
MTENELSNLIIGEAIYVRRKLGPGLLESVYEECLYYQLLKKEVSVRRQVAVPVIFDEIKLECGYRADMVVGDKVVIEIKCVEMIHDIHKAQTLTYIKLLNLKLGLLINFNVLLLKDGLKRIVNNL